MAATAVVLTALAIAYPLVNHAAATLDAPAAGLLWLTLVLAAGFWLGARSPVLLGLALCCLAATVIGQVAGTAEQLQRVPPVIIAFSLAWVFGRTLAPGEVPLISRIGARMRGELPATVACYGRRLTAVWTFFFVLMGLECLLLGLFASAFWWSLFANFLNYAFIALVFVIEYPIRRRVLRDLEHTSFLDSLRGSLRLDLT